MRAALRSTFRPEIRCIAPTSSVLESGNAAERDLRLDHPEFRVLDDQARCMLGDLRRHQRPWNSLPESSTVVTWPMVTSLYLMKVLPASMPAAPLNDNADGGPFVADRAEWRSRWRPPRRGSE